MKTKASITKKALSVFLSVLMVLSCCVTATPWLADTFGFKASAATPDYTALDAALNTWASATTGIDKTNAKFHVAEALQSVLNTFVETSKDDGKVDMSWLGRESWETRPTPGNFLADIRSELAGRYGNGSDKYNLLAELYPAAKTNDQYNGSSPWLSSRVTSTSAPSNILENVGTEYIGASRTVKDALYEYSEVSDSGIPDEIGTAYTITYDMKMYTTVGQWGAYFARGSYYYFATKPTGAYTTENISQTYKKDLVDFFNYFNDARITQDPFAAFSNLQEAQAAVDANNAAWDALYNNPQGRWSDVNDDNLLVDHFGGQYTFIAGEDCESVGYTNAVREYMKACQDTLNYYLAKEYAQKIADYSQPGKDTYLDRNDLWFERNTVTNDIIKEFNPFLEKDDAKEIYENIKAWLEAIVALFGTVDPTSDGATKGLKKLYEIDKYYYSDVKDLLDRIQSYYYYYVLTDLKKEYDDLIDDYQIPLSGNPDLTQGDYKFRDPDQTPDETLDVLKGLFDGFAANVTDGTYSMRLLFYVFENRNGDALPDYDYLQGALGYLNYEIERRGFVAEMAPFIAHFTQYINMNVASLTASQLEARIREDQAIYEDVYNHIFFDKDGNVIDLSTLGYNDNYHYNYINVYNKYYNKANSGSFNSNPLARADLLALIGDFNQNLQAYIYSLYAQLAVLLTNRITDAMNATNDGNVNGDLVMNLGNFSAIKTMMERFNSFYTTLEEATYDDAGNRTGVHMFDYLNNSAYMFKQSSTDENGYYNDDFVNTQLFLLNIKITTTYQGKEWTLKDAYEQLKRFDYKKMYEDFLNNVAFTQEHYYNTGDIGEDGGYNFTRPEAYMVRLPYSADLGRGNNPVVENDTYTVTNTMVENLVGQLDKFIGSTDLVHILSSLIDDDMQDMSLSEYVMKLLGDMLFTDDIINMLIGMVFPMITSMLEDLWNNISELIGEQDIDVIGTLIVDSSQPMYYVLRQLGLSVYPDQMVSQFASNPGTQLYDAYQVFSNFSTAQTNNWNRTLDWDKLISENSAADDPEALDINWNISSYEYKEGMDIEQWFETRADLFITALSAALSGLFPLLKVVFANTSLNADKLSDIMSIYIPDFLDIAADGTLENLTINGINGYSRIIVPLLEMLGCDKIDEAPAGLTNKQRIEQGYLIDSSAVPGTLADTNSTPLQNTTKIFESILMPIVRLVTKKLAVAPLATILELLPNLLYFLTFGTIDDILKDLQLTITGGRITANLQGTFSFLINWILDLIEIRLAWLLSQFLDVDGISFNSGGIFSNPNDVIISVAGLLGGGIGDLVGMDISDINNILSVALESVLGDAELPLLDVGSILSRAEHQHLNTTSGTKAINANGSVFDRHYFKADIADMFYELISWVAKAFQNDSFVNQIMAMITGSNEAPDPIITDILDGVKRAGPAQFVMALVEIFQPKARAGVDENSVWWNTTYMPAQYDWYGRSDAKNNMENKPINNFLYVAYQNDWTYVKANTFIENADTIISKLFAEQLSEREVNTFGELILSLVDLAWSNEAITTVMRLLVMVGNAFNNDMLTYIFSRFTETGMDFGEWYRAFGYLFEDEITMDKVGTGKYDDEGNEITEDKLPEYLVPGNDGYTNVFDKLRVKDNPDYVDNGNNPNQIYIWSYLDEKTGEYVELKDGERAMFQEMLSYILTGGDGENGGLMPALDIFLSGNTAVLFPQDDGSSLLKIYGTNGYDTALVPLFEALGMNEILDVDDFNEFAEDAGLPMEQFVTTDDHMLTQEEFDRIGDPKLKVKYLFNVAFGFIEKLMSPDTNADGEVTYNNLVSNLLTIVLPSLLYFIQSNGLSVLIRNLLQPVLTIVDDLMPAIGLNFNQNYTLDTFLNKIVGRLVIGDLLGIEREVDEVTGEYIDDYGISLKDLSFHAIANILEKIVPGLNMDPLVYGLDAICSVYEDAPVPSASEMSVDANGNPHFRYAFLTGSYYAKDSEGNIIYDSNGNPTINAANDPANVITIILSMVLDLVLADSKTEGKTNADVIVDFLGGLLGDNEIISLIPQIVGALRSLGFSAGYTMTPNWSYFDDIDRGPDDRRTTQQLIDEATRAGNNMINTPYRTIYYLRYAENFGSTTNMWSRELATYLNTALSDLVDWIIGDFVVGDGTTLGEYVQDLLMGENGFINKATINSLNETLYNSIGGAVEQFAELLNIFISFNINYWKENPYSEEEVENSPALTVEEFGEALAKLFTPLNEILTWLLSGKDMALFHSYKTTGGYTEWVMDESQRASDYGDVKDLITIPGGQGYWVVLIPLLETLGIQLPMVETGETDKDGNPEKEFLFKRDKAGRIYYTENGTDKYADGVKILTEVVVSVLSQVNGWLEGNDPLKLGDNVIDIVLNRLGNLIYFLNANGLVSIVVNLLSPLVPLANAIVPIIFSDLGIPEKGDNETDEEYEMRKFVALVDGLLGQLIEGIPEGFTISNLNLYNIFELLKELLGIDINGAVTSTFYINGNDETDGVEVDYNYLVNFFIGAISMYNSANGDFAFRMDFTDEESRADFITILLYTVLDVLNDAMTNKEGLNHKFFADLLGEEMLDTIYAIIHAKVSGYEGYDWFYFDKEARAYYYANAYDDYVNYEKVAAIIDAIAKDGYYQVDMKDTTMEYLLTGYLNYTDTNIWDEGTARQLEARFYEIVDLALSSFLGEGADLGSYVNGLLEDFELYSNRYIVLLGALLGDLLKNIPENVAELVTAAIPGLDLTYWDQYAGKAVEDDEHPAGTFDEDGTEYIPIVYYTDKAEFVSQFVSLLNPLGYLLDWILVGEGKGLELFYVVDGEKNDKPAISIGGANGFKEGLVPLLEALGLKFDKEAVNDPALTGVQAVELTLNSLLNWVDWLLVDPVARLIDLLPNIIYFINSNGLTVTVLNALRSVTNILEIAAPLFASGDDDGESITNLNTLFGLDDMGIDLYDLSLKGIMNMLKGLIGLDILNATARPELNEDKTVKTDAEGNIIYQPSYLEQWAIGKVVLNTDSALLNTEDARLFYKMEYTYTREELNEIEEKYGTDWSDIRAGIERKDIDALEERAHRMERINLFTILICTVLDVFGFKDNEETLRGWLGEYYDIIYDILNLTAVDIHYDDYDWFYFDEDIYGPASDPTVGNWATVFPEDGATYEVSYPHNTASGLIYKYGFFEYYNNPADKTNNLWNATSVNYLKENFYNLIDTVIGMATDFNTAGDFIADAWNGLNLYSKKNLYSLGATIGNLFTGFEDLLALALNVILGVNIEHQWDEYILNEVTDDETLVGTTYTDGNGRTITYIANAKMERSEFIDKLVDIFAPADFLISWFLVGADTPLELFYKKDGTAQISLPGGNGFDEALVPILEAFGCNLSDSTEYFNNAKGGKSGLNVVKYMADKLLGLVDDIADTTPDAQGITPNPVQKIVAMLPNLIYFINANGLSVSVRNLLQPVMSLLSIVNSFVDTGDIGEITTLDGLVAFALDMLSDSLDVDFDLTALSINDLSISGIFNIVKVVTGIDINEAMTLPLMVLDANGNYVPDENHKQNIYETLALGTVERFTSGNGRTAFKMYAGGEGTLTAIDMIAVLMATVVNVFLATDENDEPLNRAAFAKLIDNGGVIFDAILKILRLEGAEYVDYNWLFTLRNSDGTPYLDPAYENIYVSPIDGVSAITGTAGYDKYWTKDMARYVADNLIPVVNNVLLLIGISIPGVEGPIESIDGLISSFLPDGSLYTMSLLTQLTDLIKGLLEQLDEIDPEHTIEGLLEALLGIKLSDIRDYTFYFEDGDREGFVNALAGFLRPVDPILEWLFTEKELSLFYNYDGTDLITLPGGNGYEQAIIPLLEAVVGYDNNSIRSLDEVKASGESILVAILNPLLDFVDAALKDPLNVLLSRIPAIVYFINSGAADTMVKNLLGPIYQILNALNSFVDVDIDSLVEGAIGMSLKDLDFNAIIDLVIGLLPENLSSLSPLIVDAIKEFTIGKVIKYDSKARYHSYTKDGEPITYGYAFTMVLDDESESGKLTHGSTNATLADLITILLRAVLKWVTMPENQQIVVDFLSENIGDETLRGFVLNLYGVDPDTLGSIDSGLIGFRYTPYGISQMMALVYYVFFAANFASSAAIGAVGQYGSYWQYLAAILSSAAGFDMSALQDILPGLASISFDLSFLLSIVDYMDGLVERVTGDSHGGVTPPPTTEDNDSGASTGNGTTSLNFFQKIIEWFRNLFAKIKSWFVR